MHTQAIVDHARNLTVHSIDGTLASTEPLDAWLRALGTELASEAEASEQSRRALEQLLAG